MPSTDQAKSSAASGDQASPAEKASLVTGNYERLREYGFLLPDQWKLNPAEYGVYLTNGDEPKGGLFFRVLYDREYDPERRPAQEIDNGFQKTVEAMVGEQIGVNETKLVEKKTLTANGLYVIVSHFSYSTETETGDAIEGLFYKDGSMLWINGLFPSPVYTQLEPDIRRIIESVRKE
jgi:hypothetical protein